MIIKYQVLSAIMGCIKFDKEKTEMIKFVLRLSIMIKIQKDEK